MKGGGEEQGGERGEGRRRGDGKGRLVGEGPAQRVLEATPVAVDRKKLEAVTSIMDENKDRFKSEEWSLHFEELEKEPVIRRIAETAPRIWIPSAECDEAVAIRTEGLNFDTRGELAR